MIDRFFTIIIEMLADLSGQLDYQIKSYLNWCHFLMNLT
jgi:hypothetical protein